MFGNSERRIRPECDKYLRIPMGVRTGTDLSRPPGEQLTAASVVTRKWRH